MLKLILGRSGSGKTYASRKMLLEKIIKEENKLLLLVPEQASFENEKIMLKQLGASANRSLEVTTFTRLVDFTFRKVGGFAGKRINDSLRTMIMSLAIEQVKPYLNIYKSQTEKSELVQMMVNVVKEFKTCGVSSQDVKTAAQKISDVPFKDKLQEVTMICDAYDAIVKQSYIDPIDDLTHLCQVLREHDVFDGYTVFVDSFDGFTRQELNILECIMNQAKEMYITLCTDDTKFSQIDFDLFCLVRETASNIIDVANKNGVEILEPLKMDQNYRFYDSGISYLEKGIFQSERKILDRPIKDVTIFNAKDVYDEIDYVARTIKKLVIEQKIHYRDIQVISRSSDEYEQIVNSTFPKYDIPFFIDNSHMIASKPIMSFTMTVFDIVINNFKTEYILRLLKTGVVPFSVEEVSILENYVLLWSIDGQDWFTKFTLNPQGFSESLSEQDNEKLNAINKIREKVITPLKKFNDSVKDATAETISRALYTVIKDFCVDSNLIALYKKLKKTGTENLAQEQIRLWEILIEILDQMTFVLKDKLVTPKRYKELLKLMIDSSDISFIPQGLDQVKFGAADRIKPLHPRIVFLIGAVQGNFPLYPTWTGVFSDVQRKQLIALGLPIHECLEKSSIREQFIAYKAVTSPSEHLYIVWSKLSVAGNSKKPSSIVLETKKILPQVECIDSSSEDKSELLFSEKSSFEQYVKHFNENSVFSNTLKKYFSSNQKYVEKIKTFNQAELKDKTLSKNSVQVLFGNDMCLSASQVEKFYLCKFQYFCQYGLRAKVRKPALFDAIEYGSLVHFVLERIISKVEKESDVRKQIEKELDEYLNVKLGGIKHKTHRFQYLFSRLVTSIEIVTKYILKKTSESKFKPVEFEATIKEGHIIEPIKFYIDDDTTVKVEGKVDRIDIMESNGKRYIRIVDYKTGTKKFNLSDVLYGLNLQMLIYLTSVINSDNKKYAGAIPAGILYMPTTLHSANLKSQQEKTDSFDENQLKSQLEMNGIVLDDPQVIHEMKNDSSTKLSLDKNQMEQLLKKTENFILDMARSLLDGDVSSKPLTGAVNACEHCEYSSVCGFETGDDTIETKNMDNTCAMLELKD